MKILVASQPKTGNVWIRNLLAKCYSLSDLNEHFRDEIPESVPSFVPWIKERGFPDDSILHQHFYPKKELLEYAENEGIRLVTMLRNPYEAFVSYYFYVNRSAAIFRNRPPGVLIGKPIDHPDVIAYLEGGYRMHLNMSLQWLESGRSAVVRYEQLLTHPEEELARLTSDLEPLEARVIAEAVEHCSAERMKKKGGWKANHIRSARAKTWDAHLKEVHFEAFRKHYAALVRRLGYEVI